MLFKVWCEKNKTKWPLNKISQHLGLSRQMIYALRKGSRRPSLGVATKIEAMTGGQVKNGDWKSARRE